MHAAGGASGKRVPISFPFLAILPIALLAPLGLGGDWAAMRRFFTVDDAFFYMTIARNVARGAGATFDGLAPTSGYQPLWLAIVSGVFKLVTPVSADLGLVLVFLLCLTLTACAAGLLWRLLDRLAIGLGLRLAAAGTFALAFGLTDYGMETPAVILAGAWLLSEMWAAWPRDDAGVFLPSWRSAVAASTLVAARIDLIVWVGCAFGLAAALSSARRVAPRWVRPLVVIDVAALTVAAFLVWNRVTFGHWLPIALALKRKRTLWPLAGMTFEQWHHVLRASLALAGASWAVAAVAARWRRRGPWTGAGGFARTIGAASAVHVAALFLWSKHVTTWHLAMPALCGLVCFAVAAEQIGRVAEARGRTVRWVFGAVAAVAFVAFAVIVYRRAAPSEPLTGPEPFRVAARKYLSRDSVVYLVEPSGELAWFCDCHVLNGDGLANSWEFQDYVRRRDVAGYLDAMRTQYVVTVEAQDSPEDTVSLEAYDWIDDRRLEIATFRKSDALVSDGAYRLFRWNGAGR